ncbi:MAG: restriction endonuclease subunit S [Desulfobacterales bacterium]|nr:restriction endonuclease subunit S [Desulfobacterales bacterium]
MKLNKIADIQSGYINRGKIEPRANGSCLLLQAKDVDADQLSCRTNALIRFNPRLSGKDWFLERGDILFMARGARNHSLLIDKIPASVLAAACFFIIRVSNSEVLPEYLWWYLNQAPVEEYLKRFSGRSVHMPVVRRAVLEGIDIPIPPITVQQQVADINALMLKEQDLYRKMAEKRKFLMTEICLRSIRESR